MSASDVAIVAAVIFLWGTLSARLERYDVTAPVAGGVVAVALYDRFLRAGSTPA